MAFWIRKNVPLKSEQGKENDGRKRKDEKSRQQVKRLDNLRISHKLPVIIKSLGSRNEFSFVTKDLSSSGLFALCGNLSDYPFQQTSTILDCEVDLGAQSHPPYAKVRFLGKIARIMDGGAADGDMPGFGIRIVQISHESRVVLENYISAHGTPDLSNPNILDMRFQERRDEESSSGERSLMPSAS
jgi:hypothetical protein